MISGKTLKIVCAKKVEIDALCKALITKVCRFSKI